VRTPTTPLRWVALALITAGALALRLIDLGAVRLDPFYDAAVRSMGMSWHNFFFGAYEPGGSVSIDKPPVDLWLQVASVKLLGWSSTSLKLPEALAGAASVPVLYAALRRPFGVLAGLVAATALAVLPIEVITARSDTMDAVMMLLLVVALWALVRACETGATRWVVAAAGALGLAFNVKLLESFVAFPGLLALLWVGFSRSRGLPSSQGLPHSHGLPPSQDLPPSHSHGLPPSRARARTAPRLQPTTGPHPVPPVASEHPGVRRGPALHPHPLALHRRGLALGAVVYVLVALSWLGATLLVPAGERPYAIGSTDGSAWNAAFVFNGSERLTGKTAEVGQSNGGGRATGTPPIAPPSPTRLLARGGQLPARWLGWEALVALLLGIAVLFSLSLARADRVGTASFVRAGTDRVQRATALGVFVWLLTGIALFSAMARLHPRYVESFTPAVAATFGIGVWWVAGRVGRTRLLAIPLTALLAVPLATSVEAVARHTSDAGDVGALRSAERRALSAYLLSHQGGARYELAAGSATSVASLIVHDRRPVVMLTTYNGMPFTSVAQLKRLISRGAVRYAFLDGACGPRSPAKSAACAPAARWVRAHGADVSREAGLGRGVLWRLPGAVA
jgi:4-amino-4-deoxy-L-arabinose transferase-like glycosyltransferase